ncbi:MAG TPA: tRNA dihydrouridine synthase DusB [Tepidisphaeraceae bacterium]|nr:tRNA dihydrouridine synthase DusB [Tepidisphaeraceae bacterium]
MLQIGSLKLATNLLLAPIAGYCDLAFRLVARSCGGVGLACTDLLCPEGLLRENKRSMELAATCQADAPLTMQLYGGDVQRLCEAARWAEDMRAHVVDINMGCPVDKITKRDGGSKLLCDPDHTLKMVEQIKASLRSVPLTCKLRLGWDDSCIVAPYLARRLEELGAAAVTVHGRTTAMRFSGEARLDGIGEVVGAVRHIPVIGNGDVRTPADALRMIRRTGCRGVMIGRAALGTPWIFRDTHALLTTGQVPPPPTLEQVVQLMRDHFYNHCRFRSERSAVIEFRKRVSWYARHLHPCNQLRQEMRLFNDAAEFEAILARFLSWRADRPAAMDRCESEADLQPAG